MCSLLGEQEAALKYLEQMKSEAFHRTPASCVMLYQSFLLLLFFFFFFFFFFFSTVSCASHQCAERVDIGTGDDIFLSLTANVNRYNPLFFTLASFQDMEEVLENMKQDNVDPTVTTFEMMVCFSVSCCALCIVFATPFYLFTH